MSDKTEEKPADIQRKVLEILRELQIDGRREIEVVQGKNGNAFRPRYRRLVRFGMAYRWTRQNVFPLCILELEINLLDFATARRDGLVLGTGLTAEFDATLRRLRVLEAVTVEPAEQLPEPTIYESRAGYPVVVHVEKRGDRGWFWAVAPVIPATECWPFRQVLVGREYAGEILDDCRVVHTIARICDETPSIPGVSITKVGLELLEGAAAGNGLARPEPPFASGEVRGAETSGGMAFSNEGRPEPTLTGEARALALLVKDPNLTDRQIAEFVGVSRTTLYRWTRFRSARKVSRSVGKTPPRGRKDKGRNLDAWD